MRGLSAPQTIPRAQDASASAARPRAASWLKPSQDFITTRPIPGKLHLDPSPQPPTPSPPACLWGIGRGSGAVPKISLSPVAQSPSLAHSPAGLAAQTLPKPHPEAMRSPGRQHRTPAVLSEVTSEAPQAPAAWGPASPNLTTHPSRTLPGDRTPRPQIVSWAAGMLRSYSREEPVLPQRPPWRCYSHVPTRVR